jgi:hypothetical protein
MSAPPRSGDHPPLTRTGLEFEHLPTCSALKRRGEAPGDHPPLESTGLEFEHLPTCSTPSAPKRRGEAPGDRPPFLADDRRLSFDWLPKYSRQRRPDSAVDNKTYPQAITPRFSGDYPPKYSGDRPLVFG